MREEKCRIAQFRNSLRSPTLLKDKAHEVRSAAARLRLGIVTALDEHPPKLQTASAYCLPAASLF